MKLVKYALASMMILSFAACSKNLTTNQPSEQGEGYMSLSIEMPHMGPGAKSSTAEGDGVHAGTLGEQQINKILILVYDNAGANPISYEYTGGQLKPQAPNPIEPNQTTTYSLPPFSVGVGEKKVVVIVNPIADKFAKANQVLINTLTEMQNAMTFSETEIGTISTDNNFMMTNVNKTAKGDGAVALNVTKDNNKNNPAVITVEVERVVAKIEDLSTKYDFAVGTAGDQVKFTDVALINGNTKFFPIKKVETVDTQNYVVDPNFQGQTTTNDFYSKDFTTFPTTAKALNINSKACFYTLENTMVAAEQKNAYTTGLYYKAVYTLNGTAEGSNVYEFAGKLYSFTSLQTEAPKLGLKLEIPAQGPAAVATPLTDSSSQDDFDKIGVKKYENGVCYYPYWIRHIDNLDSSVMGPMEFAVVRNNYYQMSINSVKGIGEYKPVNPDPNTPDELVESFLDIKVKVMPWVVRKNTIDF